MQARYLNLRPSRFVADPTSVSDPGFAFVPPAACCAHFVSSALGAHWNLTRHKRIAPASGLEVKILVVS